MRRNLILWGSALAVVAVAADAVDRVAPLGTYAERERRHWSFVKRSQPVAPTFTTPADKAWGQPGGCVHPQQLLRGPQAVPAGGPDNPAPAGLLRPDRPASHSRAKWQPSSPTSLPTHTRRWSRSCWRVRNTASAGASTGWTWSASPRPTAIEYDTHRGDAWRYRDYVIRAFNNDKPFDRFVTEQLAGDEIAPKEDETLIAAGFNRLGPVAQERRQPGSRQQPQ